MKKLLFTLLISATSLFSQEYRYYYHPSTDTLWENLITNSEFNTDLSGWVDNNTPVTKEWVAGEMHIVGDETYDGALQVITLESGETYRLSFDETIISNPGGGTVRVAIYSGEYLIISDFWDSSGSLHYSDTFVPTVSGSANVWSFGIATTFEYYIDNIKLEKMVINR